MINKEAGNFENQGENNDSEAVDALTNLGEFDREAAEKAVEDYKSTHAETEPEEPETPELAPEQPDDTVFDALTADDYDSLPDERKKEILAQCEKAYDTALEDFASLGDFGDPETDRYNGGSPREGINGAKRGINEIVSCGLNEEYWQSEVSKQQAELAKLGGFHLFGRKKIEEQRREIQSNLNDAQSKLKHCQEWPEYIGYLAFRDKDMLKQIEAENHGSINPFDYKTDERQRPLREAALAKWNSDEVQAKYRKMIDMKRKIRKVKYPWADHE